MNVFAFRLAHDRHGGCWRAIDSTRVIELSWCNLLTCDNPNYHHSVKHKVGSTVEAKVSSLIRGETPAKFMKIA